MTLILTVQTRESIWLVADRRLSAPGIKPIDNAIKATILEVADGRALIGYAGLGSTALGSHPSEWVSNVLRGRHHSLEEMLQIVANAMAREFIPHMNGVRDARLRMHSFIIPAFLNGKPLVYTIDMVYNGDGYKFRYTNHIIGGATMPLHITVPIGLAGSGAPVLFSSRNWMRPLLRLVKAHNRGRVSEHTVARHLAQIAYKSFLETKDGTVGPSCIVIWRGSRGGGLACVFSHGVPVDCPLIPSISRGIDQKVMFKVLIEETVSEFMKFSEAMEKGEISEADRHEHKRVMSEKTKVVNERLSKFPSKPDEKLR